VQILCHAELGGAQRPMSDVELESNRIYREIPFLSFLSFTGTN
jgi:hypothetical protein